MKQSGFAYKNLNYLYDLYTSKIIEKTYKRKRKKVGSSLKVVFLAQYIPAWNKFEEIYQKMLMDNRFSPEIICVPMDLQPDMMKKPGRIDNPVYDFFCKNGYEAINAVTNDGSWFDLKELSPDFTFHTRPYDYLLPEPYKARRTKYYSLDCNIMYGPQVSTEFYETVWNDSYFRNVFCYFALDLDEKKDFEEYFSADNKRSAHRCYPYGGTGIADIVSRRPDEKLADSYRKRVLWTPRWSTDNTVGGSNFFRYKEWIFQMAEDYPDVEFIIRPHPLMFDNFIRTGEMTQAEVETYKKHCETTENIQLDQSKDYTEMLWRTDIMISDISGIMIEYAITKKPIVYCTSDIDWHMISSTQELLAVNYVVNDLKEIEHTTKQLLSGVDEKKNDREAVIDKLYGDVPSHSSKVLDCLWRLINDEK